MFVSLGCCWGSECACARWVLDGCTASPLRNGWRLTGTVSHPRNVRSELLLKIVLCDETGIDRGALVAKQLGLFHGHAADRQREAKSLGHDPVALWRVALPQRRCGSSNHWTAPDGCFQ